MRHGMRMKVKELVEQLLEMDQEALIVLQKDSEGNGFSPLSDCYDAVYLPDSTYSGTVPHPDDVDPDETGYINAIILFPIN